MVVWRSRFAERGLADAPRSGKPATIGQAVRDEIVAITLTKPPVELGITHWSSRLPADRLRTDGKPVSHATVARVWKHVGIQPHRFRMFKFSTGPEVEAKVRDIVGLYLNPPDKAVVLPSHPPRHVHLCHRPPGRDRHLHRRLEPALRTLPLGQGHGHHPRQGHPSQAHEHTRRVSYTPPGQ